MSEEDWARIRGVALLNERPKAWPKDVSAISLEGLALLGVHERTMQLYWDGSQVVVRNKVRLGTYERWIATIAALGTLGNFLVQAGRAAGWWG
ncbi:hypothetical protein [Methylobacterium sp. CM6247]